MSCYNGCYSTPTISCSPYPSSCTGCLEYISTDCVQYLGTSYAIGFGILQGDSLTTMVTKIYAQTASANTWIPMTLTAASTYSTFTPLVTLNAKGEVRFRGIMSITSSNPSVIVTAAYITSSSAANYYPSSTTASIRNYGSRSFLVQVAAGTTQITVTALDGSAIGTNTLIDLSSIWYDKNI